MKSPLLLLLIASLGLSVVSLPAATAPVGQIAPGVSQKLALHARLSVAEIAALSHAGFPEAQILSHLRASRAVYQLSSYDIAVLQTAGVGHAIIDEMRGRAFAATPVRRYFAPGRRSNYAPHRAGSPGFRGGRGVFHGGRQRRR